MDTTVLIGLAIFVAIVIFIFSKSAVPEDIHSRWAHYFSDLQFSSQEYYTNVESILTERKIPDVHFSRIVFPEKGIFSKNREYLRVRFGPYTFDICAAPYGIGFFVSWWFGEDVGCLMRIIYFIPLIGTYFKAKAMMKTYHILDTEEMFQQAVHLAVTQAIDEVTTAKGIRALSDIERQPKSLRQRPI